MSKRYGLILPGEEKSRAQSPKPPTRSTIFDENSSDESFDDAPKLKPKSSRLNMSSIEQKISTRLQQKALKEDPTIYQYDELYDEMDSKRNETLEAEKKPKEAKYIGRLLECAEKRKLQYELRIERQIQKEREAEGEQFKDKESFVTAAYRKKLEDIRKLEEQDKRDDYLETIGDVTKQKDLDGFYRHIYEQKTGTTKEIEKPSLQNTDEEIKEEKLIKQRKYRKRHSTDDEDDKDIKNKIQKTHLQNNMDADSDFSIETSSDSSSSEDEEEKDKNKNFINEEKQQADTELHQKSTKNQRVQCEENKNIKHSEKVNGDGSVSDSGSDTSHSTKSSVVKKKIEKPKVDIWKKRTIGDIFEAAVQRYYERKSTRYG